jgi:radical SAM superfamily enzyme YgiQ (UPF0313 family)
MRNTNIMIILPPALKGPGMVKSPPLDIANLVSILGLNDNHKIILTDFRKNILNNSFFYQERGMDLNIFNDFRRCLSHFLREDAEINGYVNLILSGIKFDGIHYVVFSVSVLEQFSLPLLMSSLCLAKRVKKVFPEIKIIFFGNCPNEHIEKIMRLFKFIDAFPMGGNEFYVADYIQGQMEGMEKGVYYRKNGEIFSPKKVKSVNLNSFPLADFSLFDLESYKSNGHLVLPYELSRGCINRCFFCYYIYKGMINLKDPTKAVDELLMLSRKYGSYRYHFTDAAINLDPDWLIRLCDLLGEKNEKVKWCALATPNMPPIMLDKLKKAGCVQLRWGVETGSERMLKKINKETTKDSIRSTLAYAHSIGINNYITLISGLAGELESDVEETKAFIQEIAPYVDSAQECIYGELGHFPLAVFEPLKKKMNVKRREARYKDTLDRLNVGREDIVDFLARQTNEELSQV